MRMNFASVVVLFAHLALVWSASAQTVTVPGNFATIQAAIDSAETGAVILVSPGTYGRINLRDRDITIRSTGGAGVTTISSGGVDHAVIIDDRNSRATVIEGFTLAGGAFNGIRVQGFASPTIRSCTLSNHTAQSAAVLIEASPLFESCQFSNNGGAGGPNFGAGATVGGNPAVTRPEFRNCTFTNNRVQIGDPRGGAIYVESGTTLIDGCTFTNNQASFGGGAIHVRFSPAVTIRNSTFSGNTAGTQGGAVEFGGDTNSSMIIEDCTFTNNTATNERGGAIFWNASSIQSNIIRRTVFTGNKSKDDGHGVSIVRSVSQPVILEDCQFISNVRTANLCCGTGGALGVGDLAVVNLTRPIFHTNASQSAGGAMVVTNDATVNVTDGQFIGNSAPSRGGAIVGFNNAKLTLTRCLLESNSSSAGGAIRWECTPASLLTITDSTLRTNNAISGGAIDFQSGRLVLRNSRLTGNTANRDIGALIAVGGQVSVEGCLFSGNSSNAGGVIYVRDTTGGSVFANCTIADNTALNSGETGFRVDNNANMTMRNCIVWGNRSPFPNPTYPQIAGSGVATAVVRNSIVQNGFTGTGNTSTDPLFVSPATGDYRVLAGSPAIDTGVNADVPGTLTTDLNGLARIVNGNAAGGSEVDRGAFEAQDCNANAVPDHQDISAATVTDLNANGVPDTCDDTFVFNVSRNLSYSSIAAAIAAATPGEDLLASTLQFASTPSVLLNKPVTLRSPAGILQPIGGTFELADGSSLRAAAGQTITVRGTLRNQPGASVEVGGGSLSLPAGGALTVRPGSVLTASTTGVSDLAGTTRIETDASASFSGGITSTGTLTALDRSSLITDGAFTNTGTLTFTNNTLVAGATSLGGQSRLGGTTVIASAVTVPFGATLTAAGSIYAPLTNSGQIIASGSLLLVGDFVNNPGARLTVRVGTTNLVGSLTDNGQIIGDFCCRSASGLWIEGSYTAGPAASLLLNSASAFLAVAGNVDLAIDSNTRFDLAVAELRMAGTSAGQTLEAMSLDRGPSPQGLNRTLASAFPVKTLRIGAGSLTTVVNTRNNTGQAPGTCEAVYADTLVLEAGSALAVPACRVYYRTLVNNGGILLDPANVRAISTCRADFDQSGVRDVSDIFAFLSAWFANDPRADLDGNGRNVQDIFSFLSLWFAGC